MEIHPDDYDHERDLKHFLRSHLPDLSEYNIKELVWNCEASFLYAYYLVKELREMNFVDEANISDYAPKGISGFYEKQFKHLRTGLQGFNPNILKGFVNVVAASKAPLPIKILFECIDLSDEEYEIRNAISNIMSEILPVYNDCLTVYHKSLTDWLTLAGYEEHAFVADIVDGTKRLWQACKRVYREIDFQKSVSDFELSSERKYALKNGGEYFVFVGDTEDFHWLVHIRLNALKLDFWDDFNVDFCRILRMYKTILTEQLYWSIVQHYFISTIFVRFLQSSDFENQFRFFYLQSIANGDFDFLKKSIGCKNIARHVLNEADEIWLDEVTNVNISDSRIISDAVFAEAFFEILSSPDNKLLVCLFPSWKVRVFELPSLTIIFELELRLVDFSQKNFGKSILTFSPDSSYFLCNSIRYCVCIRKKNEEKFIPHGPANIEFCSFSSCGLKLVTLEKFLGIIYSYIVKVWDVKKKDVLVQVEPTASVDVNYCWFSSCNVYIFGFERWRKKLFIWDSATLKIFEIKQLCSDTTCCTDKDKFQTFRLPFSWSGKHTVIEHCHFHLPSGEIIHIIPFSTKSFTWKNRKCVARLIPSSTLIVYDFVNQDVIHRFKIDCLPCGSPTLIDCVSKSNATNFLVCLDSRLVVILSFTATKETSVAGFVNSVVECCTVSPDNLYIACCYENCILTIKSVDNGETFQTVVLQHPPEACWWSESYLWVVCRGVVVKYSYDSTNTTVLGNDLQECDINFHKVLKFAEGVLVVSLNKEDEISIFKICNEKLCSQQFPRSIFSSSVAISSDGCAVLLYWRAFSGYQLWEAGCENRWELHSAGELDHCYTEVNSLYLTGSQNRRSSLWLTYNSYDESNCISCSLIFISYSLGRIDFSIGTPCLHSITNIISCEAIETCYVPSNFVLIFFEKYMHVVNISEGATIAKVHIKIIDVQYVELMNAFYLSSSDDF